MATLLDTDVAIELRDDDTWVKERARHLTAPLFISAITRIELENGIHREQHGAAQRRVRLDRMLVTIATLDFGATEIREYRRVLEATGYSRRKTADRMTAATALVHGLTLVTLNGRDYRNVPGLDFVAWERPAATSA